MGGHQLFTCQSKKILITPYRCSRATVLLTQPQAVLKKDYLIIQLFAKNLQFSVRRTCRVPKKGLPLRPGGLLSFVFGPQCVKVPQVNGKQHHLLLGEL